MSQSHHAVEVQLRAAAEEQRARGSDESDANGADESDANGAGPEEKAGWDGSPVPVRRIHAGDEEWPESLDNIGPHEPPGRLFLQGRPLAAGPTAIAVVGTRRPTAAGVEATEQLTRGLVEAGFTIVSGLAVGIDAVAHRTALQAGGYTVAVLGSGLDVDYPVKNRPLRNKIRELGTLVTEYPAGTPPSAHHFPLRNRIVVGLSLGGVLVVEGGVKSGALITARIGLDAGRNVWALPGSFRNPMASGPNELIRASEARLVTNVKHICEEAAPSLVWEKGAGARPVALESLTDEEKRVLTVLDDVPVSPDRLIRLTTLEGGKAALAVSRLEVRGFAVRRGGGYELSEAGARARAVLHA